MEFARQYSNINIKIRLTIFSLINLLSHSRARIGTEKAAKVGLEFRQHTTKYPLKSFDSLNLINSEALGILR